MEIFVTFFIPLLSGGLISLFGNYHFLLKILIFFVLVDYASGLLASGIKGELRSNRGLIGISKKIFMFFMIAVAHHIDLIFGQDHYFQNTVTYFYIANELISIIENGIKLGVPIPAIFHEMIKKLKELSNDKSNKK
ncbi:phage holin family protein [Paenibacillus thiaminolyticus]|jgi:toxin secretion/phage lysis holin|uniref:phage holin family protein n=1 Tax=Paenibacillus TaxID=44249 RepID=UPI00387E178F